MIKCKKCGGAFDDATLNYCLACGTALKSESEIPTLTFKEAALDKTVKGKPFNLDPRQVESGLEELFKFSVYEEWKYDSRFETLITNIQAHNPADCMPFIRRLIGRLEVAVKKKTAFFAALHVDKALELRDYQSQYDYLKDKGLI